MSGPKRGAIAGGVVVVLIGATLGAIHLVKVTAGGCGSTPVTLNVTAAPDIAPSVTTAASQWQQTKPTVGGKCIRIVVTAAAPSATANRLVASSGESISTGVLPTSSATPIVAAPMPAVWIPDSTVWLNRVQGVISTEFTGGPAPSLASSPAVLGIEPANATKLRMTGGTISVKAFARDLATMRVDDVERVPNVFQLGLAEPRNDATGLIGAAALVAIDLGNATAPGGQYSSIVADYRIASPNAETATDATSLIKAFTVPNDSFKGQPSPQMTVAVLSEQSILAYDTTNPTRPLEAVHMDEALASLDYPVALVAGQSLLVTEAAALFQHEVTGQANQRVFAAAGFRTPSGAAGTGFPASYGAPATTIPAKPVRLTGQANDPVAGALALWSAANTKSRVLVLINAASTMNKKSAEPGRSRIQLTQAAATAGLGLFTDDSELGNWAFAPGIGPNDYRQLVPVKELDQGNQAAAIRQALGTSSTVSQAGCGLYSALDSAYKNMLDNYAPGKINTVVIFTDCATADPGGVSLAKLTNDISSLASASKPVPVVLINVGPASNKAGLANISKIVGGQPFTLTSPADIVNVFLEAVVAVGPGN